MVLITTSRKPCARTRTFIKEFARMLPDTVSVNRGKMGVEELAEFARAEGHSIVVVVTDAHGNPSSLRLLGIDESGWKPLDEIHLKSVKLRREFGINVPKPITLLVDDPAGLLEHLGIESGESEVTLSAGKDTITFFYNGNEVGPRMVLRK